MEKLAITTDHDISLLNTKIIQNVGNATFRAMDLKERAKLMRELYPELGKPLAGITQEYIDHHLPQELMQVRKIVRRYENYPGMIGEAFMAIFLDGIEEELTP